MNSVIKKALTGLFAGIVVLVVLLGVSARLIDGKAPRFYIAHGGGAIDGYTVTNTLEAVDNAISHNIKYIELDLITTSDGKLVAAHDWDTFREQTMADSSLSWPPSFDTFRRSKVYGKYRPLTAEMIDSVFNANPELHLVTDKIRDMELIDRNFRSFRKRILVECFTKEQYSDCLSLGYTPMYSFRNVSLSGLNVAGLRSKSFLLRHFLPRDYAVYSLQSISVNDADSIFNAEPRVRFVYVDYL